MIRTLLVLLLLAAPVFAQIDYEVDNYGVFFDLAGTQTATTAPLVGPVNGYLIVLNPSLEFFAADGWWAGCWKVMAMGPDRFPVGSPMPLTFDAAYGDIIIPGDCGGGLWVGGGVAPGLPVGPTLMLGTFTTIIASGDPYGFYDDMGWGEYDSGNQTYNMSTATRFISSMPPFLWLHATINSDYTPIANEDATWSDLKAMYR